MREGDELDGKTPLRGWGEMSDKAEFESSTAFVGSRCEDG